MTAALSDGGFQRRCALNAPSIQGILKLVATIGASGAVWSSIRPARKNITVREPVGLKFPEELPLNLCAPQNPALNRAFQPVSRE
jgi:hypothetical protein